MVFEVTIPAPIGEEWDKAYEYLASGNAQMLGALRQSFVSGPLDWAKIFGGK